MLIVDTQSKREQGNILYPFAFCILPPLVAEFLTQSGTTSTISGQWISSLGLRHAADDEQQQKFTEFDEQP